MNWSFALINGRLAEIYFEEKAGKIKFFGHCYVKREDYKTKQEQKQIDKDVRHLKLVYRRGNYTRKLE